MEEEKRRESGDGEERVEEEKSDVLELLRDGCRLSVFYSSLFTLTLSLSLYSGLYFSFLSDIVPFFIHFSFHLFLSTSILVPTVEELKMICRAGTLTQCVGSHPQRMSFLHLRDTLNLPM